MNCLQCVRGIPYDSTIHWILSHLFVLCIKVSDLRLAASVSIIKSRYDSCNKIENSVNFKPLSLCKHKLHLFNRNFSLSLENDEAGIKFSKKERTL